MLPCMNKSDDDDDDDEGEGGVDRNSRNSVCSHIYTKPYPQNNSVKQLSKQAIRQATLREITKCLLTRFT